MIIVFSKSPNRLVNCFNLSVHLYITFIDQHRRFQTQHQATQSQLY